MSYHSKFKMFIGDFDQLNGISIEFLNKVEGFFTEDIAPKSIGVEFLEATKKVVLTIGYGPRLKAQNKNPKYTVNIKTVSLGQFSEENINDLEVALEEAADMVKNIICHELFITHENEMIVVFLQETIEE